MSAVSAPFPAVFEESDKDDDGVVSIAAWHAHLMDKDPVTTALAASTQPAPSGASIGTEPAANKVAVTTASVRSITGSVASAATAAIPRASIEHAAAPAPVIMRRRSDIAAAAAAVGNPPFLLPNSPAPTPSTLRAVAMLDVLLSQYGRGSLLFASVTGGVGEAVRSAADRGLPVLSGTRDDHGAALLQVAVAAAAAQSSLPLHHTVQTGSGGSGSAVCTPAFVFAVRLDDVVALLSWSPAHPVSTATSPLPHTLAPPHTGSGSVGGRGYSSGVGSTHTPSPLGVWTVSLHAAASSLSPPSGLPFWLAHTDAMAGSAPTLPVTARSTSRPESLISSGGSGGAVAAAPSDPKLLDALRRTAAYVDAQFEAVRT